MKQNTPTPSQPLAESDELLLKLLQDEDDCVADSVMERLLQSDRCRDFMAEHQDDSEPFVRRRLHQMGAILEQRSDRETFVRQLLAQDLDIWQGTLLLNKLFDPQCSLVNINRQANAFFGKCQPVKFNLHEIAAFMAKKKFTPLSANWFDLDQFLLGEVIRQKTGSTLLLCIIARQLGLYHNQTFNIVMNTGRCMLASDTYMVADPNDEWKVTAHGQGQQFHLCSRIEIMTTLLTQMFALSTVQWELADLHLTASLLGQLHGYSARVLPYPAGDFRAPKEARDSVKELPQA